jgi:hypothetical protein
MMPVVVRSMTVCVFMTVAMRMTVIRMVMPWAMRMTALFLPMMRPEMNVEFHPRDPGLPGT